MSKLSGVISLTAIIIFFAACGGPQSDSKPADSDISTATPKAEKTPSPFSKTVEMHGIKFDVASPNSESDNKVTVIPSGLEISNEGFTKTVDGEVYGAEVGDLNIDRSPEVYVYVRQRGGNKRASLVAYSANNRKSLSEVYLPELDPQSKESAGFNGEDEFAVVESALVRRFPLFEGTGADAKKTGKTRQLQYKLKRGEATWVLYVDKVVEY